MIHNFTILLQIGKNFIPISFPIDSANQLEFSTFEEQLEEKENSQYILQFSIHKKIYKNNSIIRHPLLKHFFCGANIRLITDGKIIDLVISNITPNTGTHDSVYNIIAQDELSYRWQKHNIGYNYSTVNSDGVLTTKDIFTIAKEVLADNYLYDWSVATKSEDVDLSNIKFMLEITNSNPYNVLIEACNTVNALLRVNYNTKRLDFIRKDLIPFSGYRYSSDTNCVDYTSDYSGEQLTTMLHVSGGVDSNDMQISMIPDMPDTIRQYFYINSEQLTNWEAVLKDNFQWKQITEALSEQNIEGPPTVSKGSLLGCKKLTGEDIDGSNFSVQISSITPKLNGNYHLNFKLNETNYYFITDCSLYNLSSAKINNAIKLDTAGYYKIESVRLYQDNGLVENPTYKGTYSITFTSANPYNYFLQPSPMFVPISYLQRFGQNWKTSINNNYTIEYDSTINQYKGKIAINDEEKSYTMSFDIYNRRNPFSEDQDIEEINGVNYIKYLNVPVTTEYSDGVIVPPNSLTNLTLYQSTLDIEKIQQKYLQEEKNKINNFISIAEKVPYLGQSLIDFKIFKPYMTQNNWEFLNKLINITLRNYNIQLQYYAKEYYSLIVSLMRVRSTIETYGERYGASCSAYQAYLNSKSGQQTVSEEKEQNLINAIKTDRDNLISVIKTSQYLSILKNLGLSQEYDITEDYAAYFKHQLDTQKAKAKEYETNRLSLLDFNNNEYITSQTQGQITYYNNLLNTINTLVNNFNFYIENEQVLGVYPLIIKTIEEVADGEIIASGISTKYNDLNKAVKNNVYAVLYQRYGHFIYENTYENPDELDSIGLFNQAIEYFADLNKISANHTLEVLDIGMLENINTPRLTVGSLIKVKNMDTPQAQIYSDILGEIEYNIGLQEFYKSINQSTNEFTDIINNLKERLIAEYEKNNGVTLTYNQILDKIYSESIIVSGITRVLREPIKDTVTVEENSNYKTILSKLIKSI